MGLYLVSDTGIVHGGGVISEDCGIGEDLLKIMDGRGVIGETDSAKTVLEMGEQVCDWMFVGDLDEDYLFSKSVVEWVHVDEVNGGAIVVVDFGDFEVAWGE